MIEEGEEKEEVKKEVCKFVPCFQQQGLLWGRVCAKAKVVLT